MTKIPAEYNLKLISAVKPALRYEGGDFAAWQTEARAKLAELLCKSLGIALIAEIVSGICRDLGDGGLSVLVETAGKLVILGMALPVLEELIRVVDGLLSAV